MGVRDEQVNESVSHAYARHVVDDGYSVKGREKEESVGVITFRRVPQKFLPQVGVTVAGTEADGGVAGTAAAEVALRGRGARRFLLSRIGALHHQPLQRVFGEKGHASASSVSSDSSASSSFSYSSSSSSSP